MIATTSNVTIIARKNGACKTNHSSRCKFRLQIETFQKSYPKKGKNNWETYTVLFAFGKNGQQQQKGGLWKSICFLSNKSTAANALRPLNKCLISEISTDRHARKYRTPTEDIIINVRGDIIPMKQHMTDTFNFGFFTI